MVKEFEAGAKVDDLKLVSTIGFEGKVPAGLHLHPDGKHTIYPLGSNVVINDTSNSGKQYILQGHKERVSCIAVSKSGKYVASGNITHQGYESEILVWSFETRSLLYRFEKHKVQVKSLAFSPSETFLASLGGPDDNTIVVWDLEAGKAVCGAPASNASAGNANVIRYLNHDDNCFVTGGHYNLRVWRMDTTDRKLHPNDCQLGQMKRILVSIVVDDTDETMYCGTTTGDVLEVNIRTQLFRHVGPKERLSLGAPSIAMTHDKHLIVGGGDGSIQILKTGTLKKLAGTKVAGAVTSITTTQDGKAFYVGTDESNIYAVNVDDLEPQLLQTCHSHHINDLAFPSNSSALFVTCSVAGIRVWNAVKNRELLRIQVPNLECFCIHITPDGSSIVSGWSDGKIRAFGPESGKLLYVINDAHLGGVTAITGTHDCRRVISGGIDGQVRSWNIGRDSTSMLASMKDHKAAVTGLVVNKDDTECVSASQDGSCIVWDLGRYVRSRILFASTMFKAAVYHPDQSQILTVGSDRKATYWDAYDGQALRVLEGALSGVLNTVQIAPDGDSFVSGGTDKLVKKWSYDEGNVLKVGRGHSGGVTKLCISPDQKKIVSCGQEGAICTWEM